MTHTYEEIKTAIVARIDEVYEIAYSLVIAHWDQVKERERGAKNWSDRSTLVLRCGRTGNSIRLDWSAIRWVGNKKQGSMKKYRLSIPKPRDNYRYSDKSLQRHARDWEWEMVKETEIRLAEIRREASLLAKGLTSIRHAESGAVTGNWSEEDE
jgi:hypothetical protein